ncbi:hypothetical protein EV1_008949 [Malus domestica]
MGVWELCTNHHPGLLLGLPPPGQRRPRSKGRRKFGSAAAVSGGGLRGRSEWCPSLPFQAQSLWLAL